MKVKCNKIFINNTDGSELYSQDEWLTIGKEYIVLCLYFSHDGALEYQIEGDNGFLGIFEAEYFDVLSRYIPSNWEIVTKIFPSGHYYLKLSPSLWNKEFEENNLDFYEDITEIESPLESYRDYPENERPEIMSLYFQEKDIIFREEEAHRLKQGKQ
jgi:hypothetical protein